MTIAELKTTIHRQIEKYDSACDDNQRRMASRKLLKVLDENRLVIKKVMPNFQKSYCELQYCCYQKSSIITFMMSKYVSEDMHKFISEGTNDAISDVMAEALDKSFSEVISLFLPSVISKLIHHFWDEFDKATK